MSAHQTPSPSISRTWTLRAMEPADLPTVRVLWQKCEGVGLSAGDEPGCLLAMLMRNPGLSAVALDAQGRIVGAIMTGHDSRRGYLYHLAVEAEQRGQGIGRALVAHAREGLRAAGIRRCTIVVLTHNESGAEFWRHLGWSTREDLRVMQIVP